MVAKDTVINHRQLPLSAVQLAYPPQKPVRSQESTESDLGSDTANPALRGGVVA